MVKNMYSRVMALIEEPSYMRKFNGWAAVFFAVLIVPSLVFGWVNLVVYVSVLSIWALVSGHWAAWQAARVEVKQQEEADAEVEKTRAMIEEIVQRLDERTPDPVDK